MEPFKNRISVDSVRTWGHEIAVHYPKFDTKSFVRETGRPLQKLELKPRAEWISAQLRRYLPKDFARATAILDRVIAETALEDFALWPAMMFLQKYGLDASTGDFDRSLEWMAQWTSKFSAEFAVRPFIAADPERTFRFLKKMARSRDEHQRRWASEGCRPRLPWGERLVALCQDPGPVVEILDLLHSDPSEYVRRSVANNVNDIAKDHPQIALKVVRGWKVKSIPHYARQAHHALRSLVKGGNPEALALIGVDQKTHLKAQWALDRKNVSIGQKLTFWVEVKNLEPDAVAVVVDYRIHFRLASGKHGIKVFKGRRKQFSAGEQAKWQLAHAFKPITTRVYYPGEHRLDVLINGRALEAHEFQLKRK